MSDITYVTRCNGRLYLGAYIVLVTRFTKTYAIVDRMRKSGNIEQLECLIGRSGVKNGAICHGNQADWCHSYVFTALCDEHGLRQSMCAAWKPIEGLLLGHNAVA